MTTDYDNHSGNQPGATTPDSFLQPQPVNGPARTAPFGPPPAVARLAFSVRETAALLGVSEKTVRRLVVRKLLRSSRALRHLLIPKKEIERFLDDTSAE